MLLGRLVLFLWWHVVLVVVLVLDVVLVGVMMLLVDL